MAAADKTLTFCVLAIDDLTDRRPVGTIRVRLLEIELDGIVNEDGYFVFHDIADRLLDSNNTIVVTSLEKYYRDMIFLVSKDELIVQQVITARLIPSPSYPFSYGETLIRGIVSTDIDLGGGNIVSEAVPGARVKIIERALEYISDERGEYVIYFKSLSDEDVIIEEEAAAPGDQKKFIKMGDDAKFDLVVSSSGFREFRRSNIQLPILKTTVINAKLLR